MPTIPASQIVSVIPNVLNAGGRGLDVIGLMLTNSTRVPIGAVQPFASSEDVGKYFGLDSAEASLATIYFLGFDNSNIKPGSLLFAQYPQAAVPAFMRGGDLSAMTLDQLKAIPTGSLTVTIDGATTIAAAVALAAATSFSNAASIIQAAFDAEAASCDAGTIAGNTLTVAGTVTGVFAPGQTIAGTDVTPGSYIVSQLTGPIGGLGTYELSADSTVGVGETITATVTPRVSYDSIAKAFVFTGVLAGADETIDYATTNDLATSLKLTQETGAVLSQGSAAATPGAFMDGIVDVTQDWVTFTTIFDPDQNGNANKLAFAEWVNGKANQYAYIAWDPDESPTTTVPATTAFCYIVTTTLRYSGTFPVFAPDASLAAFIMGATASIDFTEHEGRITFAFKGQAGLAPSVRNGSKASNLIANGENFYGAYATRNDQFTFNYPGIVSGDFQWFDSYINQIWLNNGIQLALMVLLTQIKSIPYNKEGYAQIEAACLQVINDALNFGAIRPGVTLSASQAAQVNSAAGKKISDTINQQGWYLQVRDASPATRQARKSPPVTLWYMDGQSVQQINVASVELK